MAKNTNQDETMLDVEELYSKSEKFVDDNKKQLSLGLGAVAAVILVVIGYSSLIVAPKNHAAEEASFMAEHYFSKDSADLAMLGDGLSAGLEEVLNDHNGTPAAARAAFQLGIMHRDAARFDEAVEAFSQARVLRRRVFGPLVDANLGDCYVELGDLDAAQSHFASAASAAGAGFGCERARTDVRLQAGPRIDRTWQHVQSTTRVGRIWPQTTRIRRTRPAPPVWPPPFDEWRPQVTTSANTSPRTCPTVPTFEWALLCLSGTKRTPSA